MAENKTMAIVSLPLLIIGAILLIFGIFVIDYGKYPTAVILLDVLGVLSGIVGVYLADKSEVKTALHFQTKKEMHKRSLIFGFFGGFFIGVLNGFGLLGNIIAGIFGALVFYVFYNILYRKKLKS